jgi:hypothetical protein
MPIKYEAQILYLLKAVHVAHQVAVIHWKGHHKGAIAAGNKLANHPAKT